MGEGHGAGSEYHEYRKDAFDAGKARMASRVGLVFNAAQEQVADKGNDQARYRGVHQALAKGQAQTDMLEAFHHGDHGDHEADQEQVVGDVAFRSFERLFGAQDQALRADKQPEGNRPREHRRDHPAGDNLSDFAPGDGVDINTHGGKTDQCANNGVGGGNRPAHQAGNQQPGASGK